VFVRLCFIRRLVSLSGLLHICIPLRFLFFLKLTVVRLDSVKNNKKCFCSKHIAKVFGGLSYFYLLEKRGGKGSNSTEDL